MGVVLKNVTSLINVFEIHGPNTLSHHQLIWDQITLILQWIILAVICQIVDMFGILTNIVNIICFVKQGFKDPVNVSLLGLSCSDMGCVITLIWTNICLTPAFSTADLAFDSTEIQYITSALPHATFTRVTSWITAFITMERCLCITLPLKVKNLVTTERVSIIIVCTFIVLMSSTAPVYVVNNLGKKFFPLKNKTLVGLVYTHDRESVEKISFTINNICVPFCAFVVIIICTTTIVLSLQRTSKWRKHSAASGQADHVSNRNKTVAKMVVMISALFISCFVPISAIFIAMTLEPELSIGGKYKNWLIIIGGLGTVLESLNSSTNIFIYYNMSSKYRQVFHQVFLRRDNKS